MLKRLRSAAIIALLVCLVVVFGLAVWEYPTYAVAALGFFDEHNGAVNAAATIIIAIFTIVLARVSSTQARLTRESIDLARTEFISTHRPKIRMRRITPIFPLMPNEQVGIQIEAANIGYTNATTFEWELIFM